MSDTMMEDKLELVRDLMVDLQILQMQFTMDEMIFHAVLDTNTNEVVFETVDADELEKQQKEEQNVLKNILDRLTALEKKGG